MFSSEPLREAVWTLDYSSRTLFILFSSSYKVLEHDVR